MKLIEFCGDIYILSDWDYPGEDFQRKFWVSKNGIQNAAVLSLSGKLYKTIIYSPLGEVVEVYATPKRREALSLIRKTLAVFIDVGKVSIFHVSEEDRKWLDH